MGYNTLFRGSGGSFVMESRELTTEEIGSTSDAQIIISRLKQENLDQMEIHALEQDIQEFEEIGDTTQALEGYAGDLIQLSSDLNTEKQVTGGLSKIGAMHANSRLKSIRRGIRHMSEPPALESYSSDARSNLQLSTALENIITDTLKKIWDAIVRMFRAAVDKVKDWFGIGSSGGGGSSSSSSSSTSAKIDNQIEKTIEEIKEVVNGDEVVYTVGEVVPVSILEPLKNEELVRRWKTKVEFNIGLVIDDYIRTINHFASKVEESKPAVQNLKGRIESFINGLKDFKTEVNHFDAEPVNVSLFGRSLSTKLYFFKDGNDWVDFQHLIAKAYFVSSSSDVKDINGILQTKVNRLMGVPYIVEINVDDPNAVKYTMRWVDNEDDRITDDLTGLNIKVTGDVPKINAALIGAWGNLKKEHNTLAKLIEDISGLDGALTKVDFGSLPEDFGYRDSLVRASYSYQNYISQLVSLPAFALFMKHKVLYKKHLDAYKKVLDRNKRKKK